jgi:hypothetical protein
MTREITSNDLPRITALRRLAGGAEWIVTLEGVGDAQMSTAALQSNILFNRECFRQLHRAFAPVRRDEWYKIIDCAMQTVMVQS